MSETHMDLKDDIFLTSPNRITIRVFKNMELIGDITGTELIEYLQQR